MQVEHRPMRNLAFSSPTSLLRPFLKPKNSHRCRVHASQNEADRRMAEADKAWRSGSQPVAEPFAIYEAQSSFSFQPVRIIEVPDSEYLHPSIAELRGSRILILDNQGNIHSIFREAQKGQLQPTRSYWDVMAAFPSLLPSTSSEGPIAILGLGAGTIARMIHYLYPSVKMEGWELDPAIVAGGRLWMGLNDVEASGSLKVNTADAFEASRPGGFPGIIVDIFSDGMLLPRLTQPEAWHAIKNMLSKDGGRVMVNLGQTMSARADVAEAEMTKAAVASLRLVFGQVSLLIIRNMDGGGPEGEMEHGTSNCLALTGSIEGVNEAWSHISDELRTVKKYKWARVEDCEGYQP